MLRIALVPFFVWFLIADAPGLNSQSGPWRWAAAAAFAVAIYTDKLDGDIARSRNLVTDFGKIADPIADKLLTGSALVMLSLLGELPWWATLVILVREWGITALRFFVIRYGVIPAVDVLGGVRRHDGRRGHHAVDRRRICCRSTAPSGEGQAAGRDRPRAGNSDGAGPAMSNLHLLAGQAVRQALESGRTVA